MISREKCNLTTHQEQAHCCAVLDRFFLLLSDLELTSCTGFDGFHRDKIQTDFFLVPPSRHGFQSSKIQVTVSWNPLLHSFTKVVQRSTPSLSRISGKCLNTCTTLEDFLILLRYFSYNGYVSTSVFQSESIPELPEELLQQSLVCTAKISREFLLELL